MFFIVLVLTRISKDRYFFVNKIVFNEFFKNYIYILFYKNVFYICNKIYVFSSSLYKTIKCDNQNRIVRHLTYFSLIFKK